MNYYHITIFPWNSYFFRTFLTHSFMFRRQFDFILNYLHWSIGNSVNLTQVFLPYKSVLVGCTLSTTAKISLIMVENISDGFFDIFDIFLQQSWYSLVGQVIQILGSLLSSWFLPSRGSIRCFLASEPPRIYEWVGNLSQSLLSTPTISGNWKAQIKVEESYYF